MTFGAFYERVVDARFAERFLTELTQTSDVEQAGGRLTSAYSREIRQMLADTGLGDPMTPPERLLLTYCLYWRASFAKGYILEVAVYHDLEREGIAFQAHDLLNRRERFARYDLMVTGQEGDIKASTYFLFVARSFPLRCAFYIVRAFHVASRRWQRLVLLKRAAWDAIDGDTVFGKLEDAADNLEGAIEILVQGEAQVVVNYDLWKRKIRARQGEGEEK